MRVVFITNSGRDIGGGHLSRCFALAQALELHGAVCSWVLNEGAAAQAETLGIKEKIFLGDIFCQEAIDRAKGAQFAVLDSYLTPDVFYPNLSRAVRLAVIDDLYDKRAQDCADVVINYGVDAARGRYHSNRCEYLLGPRYALLRGEFWDLEPTEGGYALFAPGAADVLGCSAAVAGWWRDGWPKLAIALGPLVPDSRRAVAERIAETRRGVKILNAPSDFASILSGARNVICTASVTAYESLAMEKRTAVFSAARNQDGLGEALTRNGVAFDLGDWADVKPDDIGRALSFEPDMRVLSGLVRKDGALLCARSLLDLLGENRCDRP